MPTPDGSNGNQSNVGPNERTQEGTTQKKRILSAPGAFSEELLAIFRVAESLSAS